MSEKISIEQVEELYKWLQNKKTPEGIKIGEGNQPNLSDKQAFTVIWFLQEHLGVIPENYEKCQNCGDLYDTWVEGFSGEYINPKNPKDTKHGMWCDHCVPNDIEII